MDNLSKPKKLSKMEMLNKMKRYIKLAVVVFVALFFLNGLTFHPILEQNLEDKFLQTVEENGLKKGKVILQEVHGNSCTFLFENKQGETACGTYVKSLYGRKWKEVKFFTSKMGVLDLGEITYDVNDNLTTYSTHCKFGEEPKVTFGKDKMPVLSIKTFGMCVVLMAGFAGWFIGMKRFEK